MDDASLLDGQFEEYLARAEVLKGAIDGKETEVTPAGSSASGAQKAKPKAGANNPREDVCPRHARFFIWTEGVLLLKLHMSAPLAVAAHFAGGKPRVCQEGSDYSPLVFSIPHSSVLHRC